MRLVSGILPFDGGLELGYHSSARLAGPAAPPAVFVRKAF
jgi:hypothetical protein